jgi:hypothetical protein
VSFLPVMIVLAGLMFMAIVMLRLQHYYWMQRRLVDLRLDAIHELNWLLAQFLTNCVADSSYAPGNDFLHSWNAAAAKARTLFPERALQALERVHARICRVPDDAADEAPAGAQQLMETQNAALRALYREAGLRAPH